MEKEELKPAKSQESDRTEAPGKQAETQPADQRWILALQRSAGNRAVTSLLGRTSPAPGAGRVVAGVPTVQRGPNGPDEEPVPKEERVWPVAWPEETEGENTPCFEPGALQMITAGITWAGKGSASLTGAPPDLKAAAQNLRNALESWGMAEGAEPGQSKLNQAREAIQRPLARVTIYAESVDTVLAELARSTQEVIGPLRDAASAATEPAGPDEKPEPCFDSAQISAIGQVISLAQGVAAELERRPPDFARARATLRKAYDLANGIGGLEPGQAALKGAVQALGTALDVVDAYLTPVQDVVAEAAEEAAAAAEIAKEAGELAKPGPYAAGGGAAPPEAGAT